MMPPGEFGYKRQIKCEIIGKAKILRATQASLYGTPFVLSGIDFWVQNIEVRYDGTAELTLVPKHRVPTPEWKQKMR